MQPAIAYSALCDITINMRLMIRGVADCDPPPSNCIFIFHILHIPGVLTAQHYSVLIFLLKALMPNTVELHRVSQHIHTMNKFCPYVTEEFSSLTQTSPINQCFIFRYITPCSGAQREPSAQHCPEQSYRCTISFRLQTRMYLYGMIKRAQLQYYINARLKGTPSAGRGSVQTDRLTRALLVPCKAFSSFPTPRRS